MDKHTHAQRDMRVCVHVQVLLVWLLVVAVAVVSGGESVRPCDPQFTQTVWWTQRVDHFSFQDGMRSFQQRSLVLDCRGPHNQQEAPLLFFAGNEGEVTMYLQNAGFIVQVAEKVQVGVRLCEYVLWLCWCVRVRVRVRVRVCLL